MATLKEIQEAQRRRAAMSRRREGENRLMGGVKDFTIIADSAVAAIGKIERMEERALKEGDHDGADQWRDLAIELRRSTLSVLSTMFRPEYYA